MDILQLKKNLSYKICGSFTDIQDFVLSGTLEKHLKFLMNSRIEFDGDSLKSLPAFELSYRILDCPHLLCRTCPSSRNAIEKRE